MDEQASECGQIERAACAKRFGEWGKDCCQRTNQVRCAVWKCTLRLDVQRSHDEPSDAERNRELREDARKCRDVVRIHPNVGRELWLAAPNRAPHDASLDTQTVRNDRVSALRHEPETTVLEHEDGGKKACDVGVKRLHGRGDGARRLDLLRSSARSRVGRDR